MARFYVMVAHGGCIIAQMVEYVSYYMGSGSIYEVIIVCQRITLQNVTVVEQNNILLFARFNHPGKVGKRPVSGLALCIVKWEQHAVQVSGGIYFEPDLLSCACKRKQGSKKY
ncbi:MAG: hypothetical protein BWY89_02032 [Bacteroidetes bacterium ADurb.BinA012]|nr:MAG: hypothetical protein BWY89_02032 [Bacteroidetes bacterium ADurb.BinA012]